MFLLSESTVVVVTLRVWFHGPAGEEVTYCTVANILRNLAKLEEIPGEKREGGREDRKAIRVEWKNGSEGKGRRGKGRRK